MALDFRNFIEALEESEAPRLLAANILLGFLEDLRLETDFLPRILVVAAYWMQLSQNCRAGSCNSSGCVLAVARLLNLITPLLQIYTRIRLRTWFLYVDRTLAPPYYH